MTGAIEYNWHGAYLFLASAVKAVCSRLKLIYHYLSNLYFFHCFITVVIYSYLKKHQQDFTAAINGNVTWASWRLQSPAKLLCVWKPVHANKEQTTLLDLCEGPSLTARFPSQMANNEEAFPYHEIKWPAGSRGHSCAFLYLSRGNP